MRTTPLLTAFLVAAVALAGCSDGPAKPEPPTSAECLEQGMMLNVTAPGGPACEKPPFQIREFEDPRHHCVVTEQRDRVHAPDLVGNPWALGQWWAFLLNIDGEDLGTTQLVYYADQDFAGGVPQHYMVGTPTREEALLHAVFSENPVIGRIHRILYSPHESGDHADMFHFPLCDGSTWTTVFYGEMFTLTARDAQIPVPGQGATDGFAIEGTSAEGSRLRLTYSPAAQWFTTIDLDRADGSTVDLQLTEMGTGYAGEAFFLRGQNDATLRLGHVQAQNLTAVPRDDGDDGPYDTLGIWVDMRHTGGDGLYQVDLLDPAGATVWSARFGTLDDANAVQTLMEVPFQAGDWTLRQLALPTDPVGPVVVGEIRVVSIYDRSGTV